VYQEYIDSAIAKYKGDPLVKGTVELEFEVDRKGNPSHVKSRAKESKALQDKAILILKQGPKWSPTSRNEKAKLVIKF
jgi:hypothetical protein